MGHSPSLGGRQPQELQAAAAAAVSTAFAAKEQRNAHARLAFSFLQSGASVHGMVLPTLRVDLPLRYPNLTLPIGMAHHVPTVAPNLIELTFSINLHRTKKLRLET